MKDVKRSKFLERLPHPQSGVDTQIAEGFFGKRPRQAVLVWCSWGVLAAMARCFVSSAHHKMRTTPFTRWPRRWRDSIQTPCPHHEIIPAAELAGQSRHGHGKGSPFIPEHMPRKVRAPQGKVPGNPWAARADGKCNRKIPPTYCVYLRAALARVKWCGKSAPRVRQRTGTANPTWSKTK